MNRVVIAVPARDEVKTRFAFDLVKLVANHLQTGDVVIPIQSIGTLVHSQRTALVQEAQKEAATHILFIDSDMRFPEDTVARLLAHERPVVGANCAKRRMPTGPTAANYRPTGKEYVYTEPDSTGLERVDLVGTGVMMIHMSVFDALPAPWFASPWVPDSNAFMGEDVYFCMILQRNGIPVFVDHDLSQEIGHIGEFEFKHAHTLAIREQVEAEKQLEAQCQSQPSVN